MNAHTHRHIYLTHTQREDRIMCGALVPLKDVHTIGRGEMNGKKPEVTINTDI